MSARLRHVALISDQYALQGKFYEAAFGMRTAADPRPERAVTVSDGYVGLNINPRKAGRAAGLDHFGLEVDEVEPVLARLRAKYPAVQVLKRPATRPFAGISTHDPDGNVFDLSQEAMENRTSVYVDAESSQPRRISHFALRTLHPEQLAEFYAEVYGLRPVERRRGDANFYLTDARVTLVLMPWRITDYAGTGIVRPGPDHIGFEVESLDALRKRLQTLGDDNPHLRPRPLGGSEGEARLKLFATCCPLGQDHLADPDGVLLDIAEPWNDRPASTG
jgi:catechol 2,3-dioxygenase-like lactoylglutathione lyase family enzyme